MTKNIILLILAIFIFNGCSSGNVNISLDEGFTEFLTKEGRKQIVRDYKEIVTIIRESGYMLSMTILDIFNNSTSVMEISGSFYNEEWYDVFSNTCKRRVYYNNVFKAPSYSSVHPNGCYNFGFMYYDGSGVKQDYLKASRLYKQACDGGVIGGCTMFEILLKK